MMRDAFPEESCDIVVTLLAGEFIIAGCADRFWYLRVRMNAVERVLASCQRVENPFMVKLARDSKIFRITGHCVEICQDFFHPAKLGVQRALLLFVRKAINPKL